MKFNPKDIYETVRSGAEKHSPKILIAFGIVGVVGSSVLACKATLKAKKVVDGTKEDLDLNRQYAEDGFVDENIDYTPEMAKRDRAQIYVRAGFELAKLYAPPIGLGIFSLGCILKSNDILCKRNAALAAAYTAVEKSYKDYRARVVERFGEEVDSQILHNSKMEEIEDKITDEKGKTKKIKRPIEVADPDAESPYMRYFTKANPYWENNEDYVMMFLRSQQNYANDLLRAKKKLTLNKAYDMLGFEENKTGMVTGWIFDKNNQDGDNYVEFKVTKVYLPDEFGRYEEAYAVDFNVDGNIYEKMP